MKNNPITNVEATKYVVAWYDRATYKTGKYRQCLTLHECRRLCAALDRASPHLSHWPEIAATLPKQH